MRFSDASFFVSKYVAEDLMGQTGFALLSLYQKDSCCERTLLFIESRKSNEMSAGECREERLLFDHRQVNGRCVGQVPAL